ncbi:Transcriptional activator protein CzcR [Halomonadaceae bacterium LMG 33818]|uniref:response regulator transcription factor n=1 Tax=Cernens ardua TaxID=3402176 RepID=UPI003EDC89DB
MKVLIIEDNIDILSNLVDFLDIQGYIVDNATDGNSGYRLACEQSFDLIILDIMLPGLDGYTIAHKLRTEQRCMTPIIMLTAKDTLEDRLTGFDAGADDYLVKPFSLYELRARVEAVLRRTQGNAARCLQVGDLTYDLDTQKVTRAGEAIRINQTTGRILELLMRNSPSIVSRQRLEEHLWGDDIPDSDSLRTHIHYLRRVVDKPFGTPLLHTLRGIGYRLTDAP